MMNFEQVISLCAGSFFFGGAVVVSIIFSLAARNSSDNSEGCLGNIISLILLIPAALCFYLGISSVISSMNF